MKQKLITDKQIETIERLAEPIFGNIRLSGFEKFSRWLAENFEIFSYLDIDKKTAGAIIEKLISLNKNKPSDGANLASFWSSVVRVMAKVYLKGFYDGRKSDKPLSLDELERVIRDELVKQKG